MDSVTGTDTLQGPVGERKNPFDRPEPIWKEIAFGMLLDPRHRVHDVWRRDKALRTLDQLRPSGRVLVETGPGISSLEFAKGEALLTYSHMGIHNCLMARASTTTDAFNAIAEPRRREILDLLGEGERPVNELVAHLGVAQPQVSKHLRVLREVGLVEVRDRGRQRLYRLNSEPLRTIYDWVRAYEGNWNERLDALDDLLGELKGEEEGNGEDR